MRCPQGQWGKPREAGGAKVSLKIQSALPMKGLVILVILIVRSKTVWPERSQTSLEGPGLSPAGFALGGGNVCSQAPLSRSPHGLLPLSGYLPRWMAAGRTREPHRCCPWNIETI